MNLAIDPVLASRGERLVGQLLDSLVGLFAIAVALVVASLMDTLGTVLFFASLLFAILYVFLADGLEGGQSYGKRMLGIAVVDATTGEPCTFGKSFIRNFLLAILGVIDWVFIFGKKRQRLGDKAANTIVIKLRGS